MDATEVAVRAVRAVGPDTVALELTTPHGFDALPGQFVLVRAAPDAEDSRYYTISSPDVDETFELTVGVDPEGTLSPWLAERAAGDVVTVEGPFGDVGYDVATDGDVLVLAGGPGVGPAVGIAEAAVAADHDATVVYEDETLVHEDRLAGLSSAGAAVQVVTGDGFAETVAQAVDRGVVADGTLGAEDVYVFGFQPFVERALDALETAGIDPDGVHVESFG